MNIAITGVNFINKGAELMLRAILDEVRSWPGDPIVGLPLHVGRASDRTAAGARHLLVRMFHRRTLLEPLVGPVGNAVPRQLAERFDLMRSRDVDLILDASGFAYSDQWGPRRAMQYDRLYRGFAADRTRIVLLPQAFGPFDQAATRDAFRGIVNSSTLVFARDPESLRYAREAAPDATNLLMSPDFTADVASTDGQLGDGRFARRAALVPNIRMLDRTTDAEAAWYLETLRHCFLWLQDRGTDPYFLLVQREDDRVVEFLGGPASTAEVVWEPDPLRIKDLIGSANLIVSSRYHGLVCALAQGVPTAGIGWSHKYATLFETYGCPEMLVPGLAGRQVVEQALVRLTNVDDRAALVSVVSSRAADVRDATKLMWANVRRVADV